MSLEPHTALRPTWLCRSCSQPWPCQAARDRLIGEYDDAPVSLVLYATVQYVDASHDLSATDMLVSELYDRFIAWLPRPAAPPELDW